MKQIKRQNPKCGKISCSDKQFTFTFRAIKYITAMYLCFYSNPLISELIKQSSLLISTHHLNRRMFVKHLPLIQRSACINQLLC